MSLREEYSTYGYSYGARVPLAAARGFFDSRPPPPSVSADEGLFRFSLTHPALSSSQQPANHRTTIMIFKR